jgi:prevent-host-death family protein
MAIILSRARSDKGENMARQVSVAEAKNKLPSIIHEVEEGSVVEITRHGKAVAAIISGKAYRAMDQGRPGFWASLGRIRDLISAEGITIGDDDLDGLRDRTPGRPVR